MTGAPTIPAGALDAGGGLHGWAATVAWTLAPERVTWRLESPAGEGGGASGGDVRYLKVYERASDHSLTAERERLRWAAGRLPVPEVLDHGGDARYEWLLTRGMDGVSAVDPVHCAQPARLAPLLGEALRRFHATPAGDCPFDFRLDVALAVTRRRVEDGRVDAAWFNETQGRTAEDALAFLERERPDSEDLVLCHGDYCVPNVLVRDWRLAGYVDLGALGVADRWFDLAIALWSVTRNMGPGWEDVFLEAYGIRRDAAKIGYYHALYDLQP
jgi:aminoglycoside phosphotransferase